MLFLHNPSQSWNQGSKLDYNFFLLMCLIGFFVYLSCVVSCAINLNSGITASKIDALIVYSTSIYYFHIFDLALPISVYCIYVHPISILASCIGSKSEIVFADNLVKNLLILLYLHVLYSTCALLYSTSTMVSDCKSN